MVDTEDCREQWGWAGLIRQRKCNLKFQGAYNQVGRIQHIHDKWLSNYKYVTVIISEDLCAMRSQNRRSLLFAGLRKLTFGEISSKNRVLGSWKMGHELRDWWGRNIYLKLEIHKIVHGNYYYDKRGPGLNLGYMSICQLRDLQGWSLRMKWLSEGNGLKIIKITSFYENKSFRTLRPASPILLPLTESNIPPPPACSRSWSWIPTWLMENILDPLNSPPHCYVSHTPLHWLPPASGSIFLLALHQPFNMTCSLALFSSSPSSADHLCSI